MTQPTSVRRTRATDGGGPAAGARNEVLLHGRVRRAPEIRTLPSGDALVTLRLVVARRDGAERPGSDWVDCTVWTARLQQRVLGWVEGDHVEVRGALRRRFFRTGGGEASSRLDVEVTGGRVLRRRARDAPQS